jgi:MYXO-CTERM domain-containing protein
MLKALKMVINGADRPPPHPCERPWEVLMFKASPLPVLRLLVATVLAFAATNLDAAVYLTIDGRDAANLAGDGNHAPFHNPPVNFAFTFGGVAADNPDAGPGDPPGPTERSFNFTGNDFGGLGFGTASAGDLSFPGTAIFEMDITVNQGNTLSHLMLNLKDADTLSPVQVHLIEEHQYMLLLGPAGSKTLQVLLAFPGFTNTPRDGIANFDPGNGLTELQLQYPFSAGGSGAILDITIHEMRILDPRSNGVNEPGSLPLALAGLAVVASLARRRRK